MNRMTIGIMIGVVILGSVMPSHGDTRNGNANLRTVQMWEVTPASDGQLQLLMSWGNAGADLAMAVVCGAEPFVIPWGAALGGLNRMARLDLGVVGGVPCLVGVTSLRRTSGYRLHFLLAAGVTSRARGRRPLETGTNLQAPKDPSLVAALEREMAKLRRLAFTR